MFITKLSSERIHTAYSPLMEFFYNVNPLAYGKIKYRLLEPLTYRECFYEYTVPIGFITDFMSVPNIFRKWFDRDKRFRRPSVLHDWLYSTGVISKNTADCIFYKAMRSEGISIVTSGIIVGILSVVGWIPWFISKYLRENDKPKWSRTTGLPEESSSKITTIV